MNKFFFLTLQRKILLGSSFRSKTEVTTDDERAHLSDHAKREYDPA